MAEALVARYAHRGSAAVGRTCRLRVQLRGGTPIEIVGLKKIGALRCPTPGSV